MRKKPPMEQPPDGQFVTEPYDNYWELLNKLIERIAGFNMRLKANPKTNCIEFSVDVNSVFDIAWFTLARIISKAPAPENKGQTDDRSESIMISAVCSLYLGNCQYFGYNVEFQRGDEFDNIRTALANTTTA